MARRLISVTEAASEWNVTRARIHQLLAEGRIRGAQKVGEVWVIPSPVKLKPGKRAPKPRREQS